MLKIMNTISLNRSRVYTENQTSKYWRDIECPPQTAILRSWGNDNPMFVLSGVVVDSHDSREIGTVREVHVQTYIMWLGPLVEEGVYTLI